MAEREKAERIAREVVEAVEPAFQQVYLKLDRLIYQGLATAADVTAVLKEKYAFSGDLIDGWEEYVEEADL